jgi:cell division protein FtsQ
VAKSSANSGGATLLDDPQTEFYRPADEQDVAARTPRSRRTPAAAEDETGEPFLRTRRRVPVRNGWLPAWAKTRWGKALLAAGVLTALGACAGTVIGARSFLDHDPHFRIASASSIQTVGNSELTREDLLSVFGGDIGRNLFLVPMAARRAELERFSWVGRATVMRVLPNQLRVAVTERTPIAFVQVHGKIELADAAGVILDMTPQRMAEKHYSFPVVSGISPDDPLSVRTARMLVYQKFLGELDGSGEKISARISEIDLSDPEDVRATVPASGTDLQLQFGQEDFMARWRNYAAHVAQWQAQYPKLAAVDLRYEHEVVLKMAPDPVAAAGTNSADSHPDATASGGKSNTDKAMAPTHATPPKAVVALKAKPNGKAHGARAAKHTGQGAR